jgi:nucleoid DNA-binding protein
MKLKELNEAIATACNVRPNVVNAIQSETFKQLKAALEKGDKVIIPEFGMFMTRDVPGEGGAPATKLIKFRPRAGDGAKEGKDKAARKAKRAAAEATKGGEAGAAKDDEE